MVNVLWERGDVAASMHLEDQFDHLAHEHEIAIFCSFTMDNFNGESIPACCRGSERTTPTCIPVEDYVRLERAVADALRETVGANEATVLEESAALRATRRRSQMPRAQALLLALRRELSGVAESVLERSRSCTSVRIQAGGAKPSRSGG